MIREAYRWLGTPFHHQASVRGIGCDCLGLVRGIWRAVQGAEPEAMPPYAPDWAEATGAETMLAAARRHFIPVAESGPGDLILFRLAHRGAARHAGILIGEGAMIHACARRGVRIEPLDAPWRRRWAATFRFPSTEG